MVCAFTDPSNLRNDQKSTLNKTVLLLEKGKSIDCRTCPKYSEPTIYADTPLPQDFQQQTEALVKRIQEELEEATK